MNLLFFLQPGTNSRSIFLDMIDGCRRLGHNCLIWELAPVWAIYQHGAAAKDALVGDVSQMVAQFIRNNRIDLSVTMWANSLLSLANPPLDGRPASLFEHLGHPHLLLWLDSPDRAHSGGVKSLFASGIFRTPRLYHWINNASTAREMTDVYGFANVLPHRYGINPDVFKPDPNVARDFDLVFSGGGGDLTTPSREMLEEITRDEPDVYRIRKALADALRPELETFAARLDGARPVAAREFLRRLLASQLNARSTPLLDRVRQIASQDAGMGQVAGKLIADPVTFAEVADKVRSIENFDRAFTFSYLSRFFHCGLFGSVDYSAFGCRATSVGFVGYEQQASFYARGKLGLSVMRWQDEEGLHIKPFEICASGTACIAQHRPGIGDMFDVGREILTFETPGQARNRASEVLADPNRLESITRAGRERTLRDHTWERCMGDLLAAVAQGTGRAA